MHLGMARLLGVWLTAFAAPGSPEPLANGAQREQPELPVAVPPASTPVVPGAGSQAKVPLATRPDRVRAENADVPVSTKIDVQNQMGKRFRLVGATFLIDGEPAMTKVAPKGKELAPTELPLSLLCPAGDHVLTATLTFEGRNVGPFTYMDDTRYRVESTVPFAASHTAGPTTIQVVASERKGATLPFAKIPQLALNVAHQTPPGEAQAKAQPAVASPRVPSLTTPQTAPRPGVTPARTTTHK